MSASKTTIPEQHVWASATEVVTEILNRHHPYVRATLPKLVRLAEGSGERTIQDLAHAIADEMTSHMAKEEQILFPMIVESERARRLGRSAPVGLCHPEGPIQQMQFEHAQAKEIVDRAMKLARSSRQAELLATLVEFRADLETHVDLEERVLFPWSERLFEGA